MDNYIEYDTSNVQGNEYGNTLYEERERFVSFSFKQVKSDVTIILKAYNGIEKTKRCVESLLKYTSDVDYDLWLIDNGTTDGTLDFFKSVEYEKKTILRITENKGAMFPLQFLNLSMLSKYVVLVASDLVLTTGWLRNLIKVAESDKRIGMVNPSSSNTSNLQDPGLEFDNYEEMQKKAAEFNISDPKKWHERLRVVTIGTLFTKECLLAIGFPYVDVGFAHNFADDDMSFRVRRAGYKIILAGDTWIHHDDVKKNMDYDKLVKIDRDMKIGRMNFQEKYHGLDAWDDVNEYIYDSIPALRPVEGASPEKILGINVKCGTPILEIKNYLRQFDVFGAECYAYTTEGKYLLDLQTICGTENVQTGNIRELTRYYEDNYFDHIIIGEPVNEIDDHLTVIKNAYSLLRPGGQLFLRIHNGLNVFSFVECFGRTDVSNPVRGYNYTVEDFVKELKDRGFSVKFISARRFEEESLPKDVVDLSHLIVDKIVTKAKEECLIRLLSEYYLFVVQK